MSVLARRQLHLLDQLLKPGGTAYFSEHVRDEDGTWRARLQDILAPWWCVVNPLAHKQKKGAMPIEDESAFHRAVEHPERSVAHMCARFGRAFAFDGCHCNRRTLPSIRAHTSWEIKNWTFYTGSFAWVGKFELGVAVKPLVKPVA